MSDYDDELLRDRPPQRATERLEPDPLEPDEPEPTGADNGDWRSRQAVKPDWRAGRAATAPRRRPRRSAGTAGIPRSSQEIQRWLQRGGWQLVVGAAVVVVLGLIILLALNRTNRSALPQPTPIATSNAAGAQPLDPQASITSAPAPTTVPAPQTYVVSGTEGLGLFLRDAPNGNILATLPDGTVVERVGENFAGPDWTWVEVRAPDGQVGWVALDFLQAQ